MGIADLWPVLSTAAGEREAFPVFLSKFYRQNGRPPRLAIDAYMFLFWSQLPTLEVLDESVQRRILRNFMAKLWYLVQNNVLFVVVFDGKFKPGKLRHGFIPELPESLSYDEALAYFLKISSSSYSEGNNLVESLKKILQRNRIDWVQAPAEAEAECAWLQRLGVVDYVVSDDSDTLVFGATKILRSFNRVKFYDQDNNPVLSSTDYYVTPLEMEQVTKITGLDRDRCVFIAVLRGGDYSSGSEGIGITRAKELAMCGTTLLLDSPRKRPQDFGSFPDFSKTFVNSFLDMDKRKSVLIDPYYAIKNELDRAESLASFTQHLNLFLEQDAKGIFGRATKLKDSIKIDDYYAMLYFFPFVSKKVFKFTPNSVSFGELNDVKHDLSVTVPGKCARTNVIASPDIIGHLVIDDTLGQVFETDCSFNATKFSLPRERKYNLRPFAVKLLADEKFWNHIHFVRRREFESITLAVLRFERVALNEAVYLKKMNKDQRIDQFELVEQGSQIEPNQEGKTQREIPGSKEDPENAQVEYLEDGEKELTVLVPLEVVAYVSAWYASEGQRSPTRKSPKKRPPLQKTTLDTLWSKIPKPTSNGSRTQVEKLTNPFETVNLNVTEVTTVNTAKTNTQTQPAARRQKETKKELVFIDLTETDSLQTNTCMVPLPSKGSSKLAIGINRSRSPSPTPTGKNRTMRKSPRRKNNSALLPGQTTVTSFFRASPKAPLPREPFFVPSDEETESYEKLHLQISRVPPLTRNLSAIAFTGSPVPSPYTSPCPSPRTSPSKRAAMELSPDSSPVKISRRFS